MELGSNVLVSIFKELYFPESPYAFSVVETDVISEIYEIFLGKTLELGKNGQVKVVEKPEVVASSGVVSTPRYIVDEIVQRTLTPVCQGKSPAELARLRIADIACGSGTFLLSAYEYLLHYHLNWYMADGVEQHANEVYEGVEGNWYLTLHEKQRILLNSIYGVDIDIQAVEVTQFSLLLKVLEHETVTAVKAHLDQYRLRALPNLANNIHWGNSLVDSSYLQFDEELSTHAERFETINPFDWQQTFPQIMQAGGFDVIIGNPPYIRIQNMNRYSPDEVKYYRSQFSPYVTAKRQNFDKYALFIERGLSLLKSSGHIGYIVPHKFFLIKAGKALRQLLASHKYLSQIIDFGVQQVFAGQTTTYTCILVLNKEESEKVLVEHVKDLDTWCYHQDRKFEVLLLRNIQGYTSDTWYRYGRSQSLTKFDGQAKLIWSTLSLQARYGYDNNNICFTGGGYGPYYALRQKQSAAVSLFYILAILSHPVFDAMVQAGASQFRGNYCSYGKQFIENIPIKEIHFDQPDDKDIYQRIVELVQQLLRVNDALDSATLPRRENQFFILNEQQVRAKSLEPFTQRVVSRSAHLKGAFFNHADWMDNVDKQASAFLLHAPDMPFKSLPEALKRYILDGEEQQFNKGYKCRVRDPWYVVPSIWIPEAFMLRQVHGYPKIILNAADTTCTDTIHRVRFIDGVDKRAVTSAFVNTLTFAFAEVTGRSYGGGVLTFEPGEAERLPIPLYGAENIDLCQIDKLLRASKIEAVLAITDEVLLKNGLGLSAREITMLHGIWEKLRNRRVRRKHTSQEEM